MFLGMLTSFSSVLLLRWGRQPRLGACTGAACCSRYCRGVVMNVHAMQGALLVLLLLLPLALLRLLLLFLVLPLLLLLLLLLLRAVPVHASAGAATTCRHAASWRTC
jgi:hypothetical protein